MDSKGNNINSSIPTTSEWDDFSAKVQAFREKQRAAESQTRDEAEIQRQAELEIQRQKEAERQHQAEEAAELAKLEQNIVKTTEAQLASESNSLGQIQDLTREQADQIILDDTPLVAINADWTHDKKALAHDLAEQELNAEVANGNIFQRIWKGTLFKKYYEQKYTNEFLKDQRQNPDGKTLNALIREQSKSTMERFVLGAVEEDNRYIHEKNGESLERADKEVESEIKGAIEEYARRSLMPGEKVTDLTRDFYNEVDRIMATAIDDGKMNEGYKRTNYLETAKKAAERYKLVASEAKTKAEQDLAMSQVMAGFKLYNAEVRDGVRTETHRDNIDKIVNKLESSRIGRFIPSEIVAGAAGVALGLTQTGARAILGAAGGIIASSAIAGLRERNRITEDRTRMLRDAANGLEYGRDSGKSTKKYEKRIGGTLYDMQPASDLTERVKAALDAVSSGEKGHNRELMQAIAEARVRIDFSDSEQKDLISYSSASNRGKERLELDKILISAERHLSEKGQKNYQLLQDHIREELIRGYEDESGEHHAGVAEKDKDFKNYRTIAAVKKAGKTFAIGGLFFLGSQEVMAAIDPGKIGLFEKAGILKTANNQDAKETLLASGFGRLRGTYESIGQDQIETIRGVSDPDQVAKYEAAGYTKAETAGAWSESKTVMSDVDPSASTARVDVRYDGWASNGTKIADGNEIRGSIVDGKFISNMRGSSTFNGQTVNYDPTSVKAYLTVGNAKFEIAGTMNEAGQMTWGDHGVFTTTTGETIKAIGDNGEKLYKYFEIAADNGVDPDGIQHIIPLATDVGANTFSDKIQQAIETTIEHPATYAFSKVIPGSSETFIRGITTSGIAFAPEFGRTGLGEATTPVASEAAPISSESQLPADVEADLREIAEIDRLLARLESADAQRLAADLAELDEVNRRLDALGGAPDSTSAQEPAGIEGPTTPDSTEAQTTSEPSPEASPENSPAVPSEASSEASPSLGETTPPAGAEFISLIEDNRDAIGGDEGVAILTDTTPFGSIDTSERYGNWWSGLSDEQKSTVRGIVNAIESSDDKYSLDWGHGFRTWLLLNP